MDENTLDGFWVRDAAHQPGPMFPLLASVWCEPYTRGFAEAFARWGYLGDGVAGAEVRGWFYTGFRPLSDPALVPVRIARADEAAAADEHMGAARDWAEVVSPGLERRRRDVTSVDAAASLVRDTLRSRFAAIGIQELVTEWVLVARERLGLSVERALQLAAAGRNTRRADLDAVVAAAAADPVLRPHLDAGSALPLPALLALDATAAYLDRHGDLVLAGDVGTPTLAEEPGHLADAVAAAWPPAPVAPVDPDPDPDPDPGARSALERARFAYPLRDDGGDLIGRALGTLRRTALAAGRRLGLADPADALLLTAPELGAAVRTGVVDHALLAERRDAHRWSTANPPPLTIGTPPGPPPDPSGLPPAAGRAMQRLGLFVELMSGGPGSREPLAGRPGSAGRTTGVVRVVLDAADTHTLRDGEILVCPTTAPAWNLAMMRAGAVVSETGGQLSHAAITARELGIPAVVGCTAATTALRTGDLVEVDGSAGTVVVRVGV